MNAAGFWEHRIAEADCSSMSQELPHRATSRVAHLLDGYRLAGGLRAWKNRRANGQAAPVRALIVSGGMVYELSTGHAGDGQAHGGL
jgi:hypothetical protein